VGRLLPLLVVALSLGRPLALAGQGEPTGQDAQGARLQAEVLQSIDENRDAHLDFLRRLIQAQDEGEEAVQGVVAARFGELGLGVETLRLLPMQLSPDLEFAAEATIDRTERISVVGRLPGTESGRSLLFFGHPDGEPMTEAPLSGWERVAHPVCPGSFRDLSTYGAESESFQRNSIRGHRPPISLPGRRPGASS
jgi:hypothetical protein